MALGITSTPKITDAEINALIDAALTAALAGDIAAAIDTAQSAYNNGESTFNAATSQGVVICKGAGEPIGGAWCQVQVGVAGVDIYQIATVLIGSTGAAVGLEGNIYQRFSSDGGVIWGTWTLINP